MVRGSVAADSVRVFGQVHGAILGADVVLHQSSRVEGDIRGQSLTMGQEAQLSTAARAR